MSAFVNFLFQNFWQFQKKIISDLVQQTIVWDQ
jgi:hypothetical protein